MEKFSLILALMKRRKNIFSLRTVASYQFLALWSSFYIAWHFSAPCGGCSWFTGAAVLLVSYAFFNTFWLMVASLRRKITLSRSIFNLSSLALGFIFFLMLLFIVSDFLLNIPAYANLYFAHPDTAAWGLAALAALISLYGFFNARRIRVTAYEIRTEKTGVDFTLALVSDLHIDNCGLSLNQMAKIIENINRINPDFTVFAGDIIESAPDHFCALDFAAEFRKINSKTANLAIVGNHEYYGGKINENIKALENAGLTVLKDCTLTFGNITVAGRDDKFVKDRCPLKKLLKGTPKKNFVLVLDHNPTDIAEAVTSSVDLQVSGHTHNGQIFPFNLIVRNIYQNGYGHKQIGNTHTVVSSGAGSWGPQLRLGTKAEIVCIKVKSVKD